MQRSIETFAVGSAVLVSTSRIAFEIDLFIVLGELEIISWELAIVSWELAIAKGTSTFGAIPTFCSHEIHFVKPFWNNEMEFVVQIHFRRNALVPNLRRELPVRRWSC